MNDKANTTNTYDVVKPHDLGSELGYWEYKKEFCGDSENCLSYSDYTNACDRYEYIEEIISLVGEVEELDNMSNQELRDLRDELLSAKFDYELFVNVEASKMNNRMFLAVEAITKKYR